MKKYKKRIWLSLALLFLLIIGGMLFQSTENRVAAKETTAKSSESVKKPASSTVEEFPSPKEEEAIKEKVASRALSPYFDWVNWQKNGSIVRADGQAFTNENDSVPLDTGEYETRVTRKHTITLFEVGDTIPELQTRGLGEFLYGRAGAPVVGTVSDYRIYSPTATIILGNNLANWTNLPGTFVNGIGIFTRHQEANGTIDIYSFYPGNLDPGNLPDARGNIRYKFDSGVNSNVTITSVFDQKDVAQTPPNNQIGVTIHLRLFNPQVIKSTFRAIEEPNQELAPQEVNGKGFALRDSVSASSKEIEGYEFDHYELVDDKETSVLGEVNDKTWRGTMDTTKRGVIFWYKKKVKTPDLTLTKTVDKKEAAINDSLTYTLTFENKGEAPLEDTKLTDILPSGFAKPTNVRLDNILLNEGQANANAKGEYYTWTEATREFVIYAGTLPINSKRVVVYETKVLSGNDGEKKINKATLSGSNTAQAPSAEEMVTIKGQRFIYVKQEVIDKNEHLVLPNTGAVTIDNVRVANLADKRVVYTSVIPSYEADTNQPFKKIVFENSAEYAGYLVTNKIPEFYSYEGYQVTTKEEKHVSANRKAGTVPLLDYSNQSSYWVTVYLKPTVEKEGPPFYSWDSKVNEFGQLKW